MHAEVKGLMRSTFETFKADGDDVQREWSAFVSRVDQNVEDALRQVPTGHLERECAVDAARSYFWRAYDLALTRSLTRGRR